MSKMISEKVISEVKHRIDCETIWVYPSRNRDFGLFIVERTFQVLNDILKEIKGIDIMKNIDYIKEIVRLSEGNRSIGVVFSVDNDTISECHDWTVQNIKSVELDDLYVDESGCHYCGKGDIRDALSDMIHCENDGDSIEPKELKKLIDDRYIQVVKKTILVRLSA